MPMEEGEEGGEEGEGEGEEEEAEAEAEERQVVTMPAIHGVDARVLDGDAPPAALEVELARLLADFQGVLGGAGTAVAAVERKREAEKKREREERESDWEDEEEEAVEEE